MAAESSFESGSFGARTEDGIRPPLDRRARLSWRDNAASPHGTRWSEERARWPPLIRSWTRATCPASRGWPMSIRTVAAIIFAPNSGDEQTISWDALERLDESDCPIDGRSGRLQRRDGRDRRVELARADRVYHRGLEAGRARAAAAGRSAHRGSGMRFWSWPAGRGAVRVGRSRLAGRRCADFIAASDYPTGRSPTCPTPARRSGRADRPVGPS